LVLPLCHADGWLPLRDTLKVIAPVRDERDPGSLELAQGKRRFPVDGVAEGSRRPGELVAGAAPQVQKRIPATGYVDARHAPTLIQN
jgi:hypothetical protein